MCDGEICELVSQQTSPPPSSSPPELQANAMEADPEQSQKNLRPAKLTEALSMPVEPLHVPHWQADDVAEWANTQHFSRSLLDCLRTEAIDGEVLLALSEPDVHDLRHKLGYKLTFGELKKFWLAVLGLQMLVKSSATTNLMLSHFPAAKLNLLLPPTNPCPCPQDYPSYMSDCEEAARLGKSCVAPEYFKTAISLGYSFLVTWITSFVMVIVHERVPDMKRYPPLPDIFLDNVPHIPWAFNMCEITGSLLFTVWLIVLIFHKYRMVLLRRFFALAGTVFLLRCVTMLITSLSVPGTHLQCNQKDFAIDDPNVDLMGALVIRMTRAYKIWSGLGMSIQGVRTCGDYMFSGHTVALTLLNFFITEYTPRNLYFLHTLTWLLNMFGIFFILAAHEHYSIDVFVAFYITSRLFLYYHTLANNRALMQSDSTRTRIWFPMFSYFESSVDGIIPNDFHTPATLVHSMIAHIVSAKEFVFVCAQRYWLEGPMAGKSSMHIFTTDSDRYTRAHAAASSYFSPQQSMASGIAAQQSQSQGRRGSTPQTQRRVTNDANSSAPKDAAVASQVAPLAEKKKLL